MLFDKKPFTFDTVFRNILKIIAIAAFIFMLHFLREVLIPFAVALLLAYLTDPLVRLYQKKLRSRGLAVLLTLFSVIISVALLFAIVIPTIVNEVSDAARLTSAFFNNSEIAERVAQYLPQGIWQAMKDWALSPEIQGLVRVENVLPALEALSKNVLPGAWGLITGTANVIFWILGIAFVILYLVFILMDFDKFRRVWKEMLPPAYRDDIINFLAEFNGAMHRYFRAQAAIASIVGILFAIGFEVIGLPMGLLLGLLIGLLNLVPYLQTLGIVPAFLLAIIHAIQNGGSIWGMIGLTTLIFVIVQAIQETILIPFIQKKSTGLSPAIVLLSLTVWAKILGFLGLVIAIPLTYLIYTYYMRYLSRVSNISYDPEIREITDPPDLPSKSRRTLIRKLIKNKDNKAEAAQSHQENTDSEKSDN